MAAYVIANVEVLNPSDYDRYRAAVPATVAASGGRYLARGGLVEVKEGSWIPKRLVILEFPSMDAARAWWESSEYAPLLALRNRCASSDLVIIDGIQGPP
jgi:uncharacterized protein (DUF1330 family)